MNYSERIDGSRPYPKRPGTPIQRRPQISHICYDRQLRPNDIVDLPLIATERHGNLLFLAVSDNLQTNDVSRLFAAEEPDRIHDG